MLTEYLCSHRFTDNLNLRRRSMYFLLEMFAALDEAPGDGPGMDRRARRGIGSPRPNYFWRVIASK